ncbi:MAG: hypothetical protein OXL96_05680 [Candidatus Poribacteria bacterium]|nr:hypothetical protein [Candidatus Poribacteria bacterium]
MSKFLENIVLSTAAAIQNTRGMIEDAENQARAEIRAAEFTNCPACQSGLVIFLNDTPHASHEAIQAVVKTLWETCPTCIGEYTEYHNSIKCEHGIENWENCVECLDAWADACAPEDVFLDNPSDWEVQNGI